jgi:hypothetical protein
MAYVLSCVLLHALQADKSLKAAQPDGSAIARLAPSPMGDCVAVATQKGIFAVDLLDHSVVVSNIATKVCHDCTISQLCTPSDS